MQKPLTVSIVIPVYNEEYYLKRCLSAIAAQTSQADEIIVVDNNSTDNTVSMARQFPAVRIVNEKTQGVLFASRKGFNKAASDIICRIDADSVLAVDWVEQVRNFFTEHEQIAAVTGNCYFYDFPFRKIFWRLHHAVYYDIQKLIAGTEILWGSNMAMTAVSWKNIRADCINNPGIHEDMDLSFHLQNHGLFIRRSPKLQVGVSMMRGNLTPLRLIRYIWPWPTNSLASYFWSWPRTYWVNKRYVQAVLITTVMLVGGLIAFPFACLVWLPKFFNTRKT